MITNNSGWHRTSTTNYRVGGVAAEELSDIELKIIK